MLGVVLGPSTTTDKQAEWLVRPMGQQNSFSVRAACLRTARKGPGSLLSILMGGLAVSCIVGVAAHGSGEFSTTVTGVVAHLSIASGPGSFSCVLAAAASLIWYLTTVATCYWLHQPLLAEGVFCPAISEMAMSSAVTRLSWHAPYMKACSELPTAYLVLLPTRDR